MFKKIFSIFFFLFSFTLSINNLFGIIVLLNGPTSCGKSSIAEELLNRLDSRDWVYIALDDIPNCIEESQLHNEVCKKIKQAIICEKNVICDTVLDNKKDFEDFCENFKNEEIIKVLIHCSLISVIKHLEMRNDRCPKNEKRYFQSVIEGFLAFYTGSETETEFGIFSMSDVKIAFESKENTLDPRIQERYFNFLSEICKFNPETETRKIVNLALKFGKYNIIVYSGRNSPKFCAEKILHEISESLKMKLISETNIKSLENLDLR